MTGNWRMVPPAGRDGFPARSVASPLCGAPRSVLSPKNSIDLRLRHISWDAT